MTIDYWIVVSGQNDIKKLRRENEQLRREIWGLRDEYDKLEELLKKQKSEENISDIIEVREICLSFIFHFFVISLRRFLIRGKNVCIS